MRNCLRQPSSRQSSSEMNNSSVLVKPKSDNLLPSMELNPLVIDTPSPN